MSLDLLKSLTTRARASFKRRPKPANLIPRKRSNVQATVFALVLLLFCAGLLNSASAQRGGGGHGGGGGMGGQRGGGMVAPRGGFDGGFGQRGNGGFGTGQHGRPAPGHGFQPGHGNEHGNGREHGDGREHGRGFGFWPFGWGWGWDWYYPYGYEYYPYGSYNNYTYYYDPAAQGYNDGFRQGKDDAANGRSSDPNRDGRVRYSGSSVYRDGYLQGYAAGYGAQAPGYSQPPNNAQQPPGH